MKRFDANRVLTQGFPTDVGRSLADKLLQLPDWDDLLVDLWHTPPGTLISAFFNGFLQRVFEVNPERLPQARALQWDVKFPFQKENVARFMADFKPLTGAYSATFVFRQAQAVITGLMSAAVPFSVEPVEQGADEDDECVRGSYLFKITVASTHAELLGGLADNWLTNVMTASGGAGII